VGAKTQANENGQMISDDGIEIPLNPKVLAAGCVRRCRKSEVDSGLFTVSLAHHQNLVGAYNPIAIGYYPMSNCKN
jgi:hypothetical protein